MEHDKTENTQRSGEIGEFGGKVGLGTSTPATFCVCKLTQAQKDRGGGKGVFRIPYASQVKTATRAEA